MDDFEFLIDENLAAYIEEHTTVASDLLKELDRETHLKVLSPRMISGAYQGKFLEMISKMLKPKKILEVGSFTGYSAICLAQGLAKGGTITAIEHDKLLDEILPSYIKKAGLSSCVNIIWGEAIEILPQLDEESFDLVFLDADKENYISYYPLIKRLLSKDGCLLVDNVLWNGKVWNKNYNDKVTKKVREFNDMIQADEEVENIMLFLRDGFTIVRKIK